MKILFLTTAAPCGHDYAADFLLAGFVNNAVGRDEVYDYPEKPNVHLSDLSKRDRCMIDSDQALPYRRHSLEDAARNADLVVLGYQPFIPGVDVENVRRALSLAPAGVPVAAIDGSDHLDDLSHLYQAHCGRGDIAYFKREYPIGADYGPRCFPLPLSYPRSRVPKEWPSRQHRLCYHASSHGGAVDSNPALPRITIVDLLRRLVSSDKLDVDLYPGSEGPGRRMRPEQYHERLMRSSVGLSWNGASNWDSNRFWENFAFGVAQVAERPRIQIPNAPVDGEHCLYADSPHEAAFLVRDLLDGDPVRVERMRLAGHHHFQWFHASEARAAYVVEMMKEVG